jgi:hypothetical protein
MIDDGLNIEECKKNQPRIGRPAMLTIFGKQAH